MDRWQLTLLSFSSRCCPQRSGLFALLFAHRTGHSWGKRPHRETRDAITHHLPSPPHLLITLRLCYEWVSNINQHSVEELNTDYSSWDMSFSPLSDLFSPLLKDQSSLDSPLCLGEVWKVCEWKLAHLVLVDLYMNPAQLALGVNAKRQCLFSPW